jgi:nitrate/nitrite transporter NarK
MSNAGGPGVLSDKIGRRRPLTTMMVALLLVGSVNASLMVFNYGANFSLSPSSIKDFFWLNNFGAIYGLVFMAWGVGGFVLPKFS